MSLDSSSQPGDGITIRGTFNLLYIVVSGMACCATPFLRTNFGSEALGMKGLAALAIIVAYICAYPSYGMVKFLHWWFLALVLQRLRTFWLRWRGQPVHSQYVGDPWLCVLFPSIDARQLRIVDPFVWFLVAVYMASTDPWLGRFLAYTAVGLLVRQMIDGHIHNQRAQSMIDAELQQRATVARVRQRRGY